MPEGKVFDMFTRRSLEVDSKSGELTDLPELSKKLDTDLNMLTVTELLETLTQFKQQGSLVQRNIDLRRELVRDSEDAELFTWINSSTDQDWQVRPSFYAAVYEELLERDLISAGKE